jgi:hypothetical protein
LSKLLFSDGILFLARANYRERDEHRQDQNLFHIRRKLGLVNSGEENGMPRASQMKPWLSV